MGRPQGDEANTWGQDTFAPQLGGRFPLAHAMRVGFYEGLKAVDFGIRDTKYAMYAVELSVDAVSTCLWVPFLRQRYDGLK